MCRVFVLAHSLARLNNLQFCAGAHRKTLFNDDIFVIVIQYMMENCGEEDSKQGWDQNIALLYGTSNSKADEKASSNEIQASIIMQRLDKTKKSSGRPNFFRTMDNPSLLTNVPSMCAAAQMRSTTRPFAQ